MALLDPQQKCIVLRVIYDGPAFAGKTTNLRALAKSLESTIFSGQEADGRTLYFDWVDYVGGRFEGMPIRCQIVSVPGQRVLEGRRKMLLETADVVVFVADSRPDRLSENIVAFDLLRRVIASQTPPMGIVVQANKRDIDEPVSLEDLQDALGGEVPLAMTNAVAECGDGVRETFILAVRLALDRVRELWNRQTLFHRQPPIDSGPALLSAVQAIERGELADLSSGTPGGTDRRFVAPVMAEPPKASSPRSTGPPFPETWIPTGSIWPPVEGRVVVHQSSLARPRLERGRNGDWLGISRDWMLRAPLEALFFDPEIGRAALLEWARWHALAAERLSGPRSIVLMPEAGEAWRLWQIVRRSPTLHDTIGELFAQPDDVVLGKGLFRVIALRLRAERDFVATGWIGRLDLTSVGASKEGSPLFTSFSPYPGGSSSGASLVEIEESQLVRRELGPLMRRHLGEAPRRLPAVLSSLRDAAEEHGHYQIAESIREILLGS